MPALEFWLILSYIVNAIPVIGMLIWIFQSQMEDMGRIFGHNSVLLFGFSMLLIGLILDSLRHALEWLVEWALENRTETIERLDRLPTGLQSLLLEYNKRISYCIKRRALIFKGKMEEEDRNTLLLLLDRHLYKPYQEAIEKLFDKSNTGGGECAFYPRLFIEDIGYLQYPKHTGKGTPISGMRVASGHSFAEALFTKKLRRYEVRFFVAEGLLGYTLGCLFAGLLLLLHMKFELFGVEKECANNISWAILLGLIIACVGVPLSILWCRDKILFINSILHYGRHDLFYLGRKIYFSIFIGLYIIGLFLCGAFLHTEIFGSWSKTFWVLGGAWFQYTSFGLALGPLAKNMAVTPA